MNNLTAAVPTHEYFIQTKCGRLFVWSVTDMEDLFRKLIEKGLYAQRILPYEEYEAELAMKHEQDRLNREHEEAIEKGDSAA